MSSICFTSWGILGVAYVKRPNIVERHVPTRPRSSSRLHFRGPRVQTFFRGYGGYEDGMYLLYGSHSLARKGWQLASCISFPLKFIDGGMLVTNRGTHHNYTKVGVHDSGICTLINMFPTVNVFPSLKVGI